MVIDLFRTNIEKEAKALIEYMDLGDLNVELLRLKAKATTDDYYADMVESIKAEQIQIVERAIYLLTNSTNP